MVTDAGQTPNTPRSIIGPCGLVGVWFGTLLVGLVTTVAVAAGWAMMYTPKWPDTYAPVDPIAYMILAGLAASLVVATVVTLLVRKRRGGKGPGRTLLPWLVAWAVLLPLCAAGLWLIRDHRDKENHARTTSEIVGTWEVRSASDAPPNQRVTFRADGTYESTWLTGPEHERSTYRGNYMISKDGRCLEFRDHNSSLEASEPKSWGWNIEFLDKDHFREWSRSWHYRATNLYERKR
jgi:hypothetical protein